MDILKLIGRDKELLAQNIHKNNEELKKELCDN
jgi:hypothetical protein